MSEESKPTTTVTTNETEETKKIEKEEKKRQKNQTGRKGMILTDPIAGTRDFLPEEMRIRNWLFDHFKEVSRVFGFEEYDAPILG